MTLGEGKRKVYMLLDEYSSGGQVEHDPDIEAKMADFFDMAQKELAFRSRIVKVKRITPQPGKTEYAMPADFLSLRRIWRDGRTVTGRYRWLGGKLLIPERDEDREILVEYCAVPETVDGSTPDDYEFELSEEACRCMPYYVAAQQLLPDLVMDYGGMLNMYRLGLEALPSDPTGDSARLNQRLFG